MARRRTICSLGDKLIITHNVFHVCKTYGLSKRRFSDRENERPNRTDREIREKNWKTPETNTHRNNTTIVMLLFITIVAII